MLLERLEKEIISKLGGGSMCRRNSSVSPAAGKRLSGKRRRRESKQNNHPPALRTGATKANNENVVVKVDVSMSTAESVVRSRFIVGEYYFHDQKVCA